jgi:hypothetical protein
VAAPDEFIVVPDVVGVIQQEAAGPGEVVALTIGAGKPVGPTIPGDQEIVIPIPRDFAEPVTDRSSDDPGVRDVNDPRTQRGW